jgi:hypothetical protein
LPVNGVRYQDIAPDVHYPDSASRHVKKEGRENALSVKQMQI